MIAMLPTSMNSHDPVLGSQETHGVWTSGHTEQPQRARATNRTEHVEEVGEVQDGESVGSLVGKKGARPISSGVGEEL